MSNKVFLIKGKCFICKEHCVEDKKTVFSIKDLTGIGGREKKYGKYYAIHKECWPKANVMPYVPGENYLTLSLKK